MKNLTIIANVEQIENNILNLKDKFEPYYVKYGESLEWNNTPFTKEEYDKNVDVFLEDFKKSVVNLNSIIESFPKKKNGTFNRRNVIYLAECENCICIHEWHNTWIYQTVKVSAISDTELEIVLYEKVDTPA
ncbi:MAG: hypothetical protein IJZ79_03145 [Bacilli bacterium]|nr:hypothetical protein [Bacilli bacterium]MBQ8218723.1 hypothetical protein [Bacilli bacterium]